MKVMKQGFAEAAERIKWFAENFDKVRDYILMRCVEDVLKQVSAAGGAAFEDYVHRVRIDMGSGNLLYGISVEPMSEEYSLDGLDDCVLFAVVDPEHASKYGKLLQGEPWLPDHLPTNIDKDHGYFLRREVNDLERETVGASNRRSLGRMQPLHVQTKIILQYDWRYTLLRGEYGLGDKPSAPIWVPAINKMFSTYTEDILESIADMLVSGKLMEVNESVYEDRSSEWYEQHASSMIGLLV